MSIRVDDTSLIAGAIVVGDHGLGVLAQNVPSTGDAGAGYAYAYLSLPADNGKEVRGLIVTPPSAGTLTSYEDTSFVFEAPDGEYSFTWQLYLDGVASGNQHTEILVIGESAIPHVNTPPTGSVTISGTPTQGQTLTASNTLSDVDGIGTITYTWRANGTIVGTGTTYVLQAGDVGDMVTVTASYTDGYGTAESVTSAAVGPVVALPHVNTTPTGTVSIAGTPTQGQTLSVVDTLADVDGLGQRTYTWKFDGAGTTTGATYTLTAAEVGKYVAVIASYVDGHGAAESVASASVGPVVSNYVQPPVEVNYGGISRVTSVYKSPEEGGNIYTGDVVRIFYSIKHNDLTPYDLSGLTLKFALARSVSGPAIITKTIGTDLVVVDAANGEIKVVLRPEDSAKLAGQYYTEIKAFSGTNPTTIHTGMIYFSKTLIKKG